MSIPAKFNAQNRMQHNCLRCLCEVETGSKDCNKESCKSNISITSKSCGPFSLDISYYFKCGTPEKMKGESLSKAHQRCALNPTCAKECVKVLWTNC